MKIETLGWAAQLNRWGDPTGTYHALVKNPDGPLKPLCGSKASLGPASQDKGYECRQCRKRLDRG